jgi:hypothetical protein
MDFNLSALKKNGFRGFVEVKGLLKERSPLACLPNRSGVYVFFRCAGNRPRFCNPGTGGWFRGKNPNAVINILENKWVDGAHVVYIGQTKNIRQRIKTRLEFGRGLPVRAWGGRYIWQLKDVGELQIAWKEVLQGDLRKTERRMINQFKRIYGGFPYANLR